MKFESKIKQVYVGIKKWLHDDSLCQVQDLTSIMYNVTTLDFNIIYIDIFQKKLLYFFSNVLCAFLSKTLEKHSFKVAYQLDR